MLVADYRQAQGSRRFVSHFRMLSRPHPMCPSNTTAHCWLACMALGCPIRGWCMTHVLGVLLFQAPKAAPALAPALSCTLDKPPPLLLPPGVDKPPSLTGDQFMAGDRGTLLTLDLLRFSWTPGHVASGRYKTCFSDLKESTGGPSPPSPLSSCTHHGFVADDFIHD
jgi:hypothetical protein